MTDLSIGNDTFKVKVEGDATKPVLLLSNSLGSDLTLWDAQMPDLLNAFRVVRYDSRGHGGSTIAGAPYSIARLGRDALGILDALEIEKVHFMGISMGGAVGLWLLANAPDRIERAVLANTTARFGVPKVWNERIVSVLNDGLVGLADATMSRWFSAGFAAKEPERVAAVRAVFEAVSPAGYAGCCAALRDLDLRSTLHGVSAPVLIITGSDDASIATNDTADLLKVLPHAKHVELAAHHISNIEAEAAFTKAALTFLTAKSPAKPTKRIAPPAIRPTLAGSRRVGIRRPTTARIPLAPATKVARSAGKAEPAKSPARKTEAARPKVVAPTKSKTMGASAAPTGRAQTKSAKVETPGAKASKGKITGAKAPAAKASAVKTQIAKLAPAKVPAKASSGGKAATPKTASRASAKSLKAMAAKGSPTKQVAKPAAVTKRKGTTAAVAKKPASPSVPANAKGAVAKSATARKAPSKTTPVKTAPVKTAARKIAKPTSSPAKKTSVPALASKTAPKTKTSKTPAPKAGAKAATRVAPTKAPTAKPAAKKAAKPVAKSGRRA